MPDSNLKLSCKDFPDELAKLCSLPPVAEWISAHDQAQLEAKLDRIVRVYRGRIVDGARRKFLSRAGAAAPVDYDDVIKECSNVAFNAADTLQTLTDLWSSVEERHAGDILEMASLIEPVFRNTSADTLLKRLSATKRLLETLSIAIPNATFEKPGPREKGRPGGKHLLPASELAMLWNEMSGGDLFTPRKRSDPKDRIATQYSTVFVRSGLKMIDPNISESQVSTAIMALMKHLQTTPFRDLYDSVLIARIEKW